MGVVLSVLSGNPVADFQKIKSPLFVLPVVCMVAIIKDVAN
ncbi:hypothetical protein ACP4OV_012184 [Aristida adscensionis]